MRPAALGLANAIVFFAFCSATPAQQGTVEKEGVVSGTGQVVLDRLPDTMRMQVAILSKADTLKEALDSLKERIEAAKAQLASMGVDNDSIEVGGPKIASLKSAQQIQMERMMREQLKRAGRKQPNVPAKTPVIVSAELKAEWKLSAKTAEELLLASYPLQEKVKAADLAGTADATKVSEEEQEMLEETETQFGGYSADGEAKPGEPVFYFVAKFSDDEIAKALAEAFQKSKVDAERLCTAAGLKLGSLVSMSWSNESQPDYTSDIFVHGGYASPLLQIMQQSRPNQKGAEAIGAQPENVRLTLTISTSFHLSPQ
jgi:uncharacterized protein YggE